MNNPDYIFETSWEVCNKVGGICAVLATRSATMQTLFPDHVVFFGPDLGERSDQFFREDKRILGRWQKPGNVRVGRWQIPGNPIAVLVNYQYLWPQKDEIYSWAWNHFGVQSHAAYGDYDDSAMFGYAVGEAMSSLQAALTKGGKKIKTVAHAHEWQTAFTLFYLKNRCPDIATIFTTHATGIGRSIAGNGKPLYDYFTAYNGDQMASELNMVSKHSAEKNAARVADCFTTVSEPTARECEQLLERRPDVVLPNGFEQDFVPKGKAFTACRQEARRVLAEVAGKRLHLSRPIDPERDYFIGISGRLEWRNKGIDVFLDAVERLAYRWNGDEQVVAFVLVPYLDHPSFSHNERVHVVFVPYYLDGHDPLVQRTYYDTLIGLDATVFPSYYEPWGYTPLESAAFSVPTITTTLSGFGQWAKTLLKGKSDHLTDGVCVMTRTDSNGLELIEQLAGELNDYLHLSADEKAAAGKAAAAVAKKTLWKHFFKHYLEAYSVANTRHSQS